MDFEVGGPGEVPNPTRPEQWVLWDSEPRLSHKDAHHMDTACWALREIDLKEQEQDFEFLFDYFNWR